jgi:hypothetical protein
MDQSAAIHDFVSVHYFGAYLDALSQLCDFMFGFMFDKGIACAERNLMHDSAILCAAIAHRYLMRHPYKHIANRLLPRAI